MLNAKFVSAVITFIIFHWFINYLLIKNGDKYYNTRVLKKKTTPKIYDISYLLPDYSKYYYVSDIYTSLCILLMVFSHTQILKEFIEFGIILFIIRDITISVTILPKVKECDTNNSNLIFGGCYDKIFSGHLATVLLLSLLMYKYKIITNVYVLSIINIVNALLILTVRAHYTIDIIVAIFVTLFLFTNNIKLSL